MNLERRGRAAAVQRLSHGSGGLTPRRATAHRLWLSVCGEHACSWNSKDSSKGSMMAGDCRPKWAAAWRHMLRPTASLLGSCAASSGCHTRCAKACSRGRGSGWGGYKVTEGEGCEIPDGGCKVMEGEGCDIPDGGCKVSEAFKVSGVAEVAMADEGWGVHGGEGSGAVLVGLDEDSGESLRWGALVAAVEAPAWGCVSLTRQLPMAVTACMSRGCEVPARREDSWARERTPARALTNCLLGFTGGCSGLDEGLLLGSLSPGTDDGGGVGV